MQTTSFHKMGVFTQYALELDLRPVEYKVYSFIARMCIGYNKPTTDHLSIDYIVSRTNLSKPTVITAIKKLLDKELITKLKVNCFNGSGKVSSKYQINFKAKDFPSLGDFGSEDKETKSCW